MDVSPSVFAKLTKVTSARDAIDFHTPKCSFFGRTCRNSVISNVSAEFFYKMVMVNYCDLLFLYFLLTCFSINFRNSKGSSVDFKMIDTICDLFIAFKF